MEIIRSYNTLKSVTLVDGTKIYNPRKDKLFVPEYGTEIRIVEYGNHFIFEVPARIKGPSWMCSCGSPAVMVGANAYSHLSSYKEAMIVCQVHTQGNRHADGAS